MTILDPGARPGHDGRDAAKPSPPSGRLTFPPRPGTLTAARPKLTLALNAAGLNALPAQPRAAKPMTRPVIEHWHGGEESEKAA